MFASRMSILALFCKEKNTHTDMHTHAHSYIKNVRHNYILALGLFKAKGRLPKPAICDTGGERRSLLAGKHTRTPLTDPSHTHTHENTLTHRLSVCEKECVDACGF